MRWFIIIIKSPEETDQNDVEGVWLYQLISEGFQSSLQQQIMIIVSDWNMSQAALKDLLQSLNKTWKTYNNSSRKGFLWLIP